MAKAMSAAQRKKMDAMWKKGRGMSAADAGAQGVPDGRYAARIIEAGVKTSQKGNPQAVIKVEVVKGEQKGGKATAFEGLTTEKNMYYFNALLERLGYDECEDFAGIEAALGEMVERKLLVGITAKTDQTERGPFSSIRINNILEDDGSMGAGEGDDEEGDEEGGWDVGDTCVVDIDGTDYTGEITAWVDDENVTVTFEDGDVEDHPVESLKEVEGDEEEEEEEEEEEDDIDLEDEDGEEEEDEEEEDEDEDEGEEDESDSEWEEGTRVTVDFDGEAYAGEITAVDDSNATVKFDDGTEEQIALTELTAADDDEEGDPSGADSFDVDDEVTFYLEDQDQDVTGKITKFSTKNPDLAGVKVKGVRKLHWVSVEDLTAA